MKHAPVGNTTTLEALSLIYARCVRGSRECPHGKCDFKLSHTALRRGSVWPVFARQQKLSTHNCQKFMD